MNYVKVKNNTEQNTRMKLAFISALFEINIDPVNSY